VLDQDLYDHMYRVFHVQPQNTFFSFHGATHESAQADENRITVHIRRHHNQGDSLAPHRYQALGAWFFGFALEVFHCGTYSEPCKHDQCEPCHHKRQGQLLRTLAATFFMISGIFRSGFWALAFFSSSFMKTLYADRGRVPVEVEEAKRTCQATQGTQQ